MSDLGVGIVGGLVATLLWTLIVLAYLRLGPWRRFRRLAGTYRVARKLRPDEVVCNELEVSVSGNKLRAWSTDYEGGEFHAEIIMSRDLQYSGRGSYKHLAAAVSGKTEMLWGFVEVEFEEEGETLLVHHTYAHPTQHRAVVSGFVWSRTDDRF